MEYVIVRTNRKTLSISINNNGEVKVSAPKYMDKCEIEQFLERKSAWIQRNIASSKCNMAINNDIISYNSILLFGEKYRLDVNKGNTQHIDCTNKALYIIKTENIKKILNETAYNYILERIKVLSNIIRVDYTSITIGNYKRKWGSCDRNSNIKFNFRLCMLDKELIDYVIVHELCHIKELNHSVRFWSQVEKYCNNYKLLRTRLKQFSFLTELY